MTATQFAALLGTTIITPILYVLFAAAMIVFVWGLIELLVGLSNGKSDQSGNGKKHLLYGLIGLFIMLTVSSIINLVVNAFAPGCWPPQGTNCSNYGNPSPGQ